MAEGCGVNICSIRLTSTSALRNNIGAKSFAMNFSRKLVAAAFVFLLLCVMAPSLSFANSSFEFSNSRGKLTGTNAALTLSGSALAGIEVSGVTVQLRVNTGRGFFAGSTRVSGGETYVSAAIPEPSTFALFGAGVLSFLGMICRKRLELRL